MNMRQTFTTGRLPRTAALLAGLALGASSSCATSNRVARTQTSPAAEAPATRTIAPQTTFTADSAVEHAVVAEPSPLRRTIQPLEHETSVGAATGSQRGSAASGFVASGQSPEPLCEPIPYAPVPRMPVMQGCPPGIPCPPVVGIAPPLEEPPYPEEMLCDGGDDGYPFHYEGQKFSGLEPEDTVAEFVDHEGTAHIRISSQACVYAPKFGSVRSISQPVLDYTVDVLGGAHDRTSAAGMDNRKGLIVAETVDSLADTRVREQAGGVDSDVGEGAMHQTIGVEQHVKLVNVFEDRIAVTEGQFEQTTEAYLAESLLVAGESTHDIAPIIVANDEFGHAVTSADIAAEYTAAEDRRPPGDLRIVKLADQATAQPGDVLTFRIRFFNDGGRELTSVRILDHLSPRLEYVEGSVASELKGKLTVEHHDYGGQILQFELGEPLVAGGSGEIVFEAVAK
jgi:uncharacterized repeat protein (TIGR01451 family)